MAEFTNDQLAYILRALSNSTFSYLNDTVGYAQLDLTASGGAVQDLTSVLPADARYALCIAESDATGYCLRYMTDGSNPSASFGMPRQNNDSFDVLSRVDLENFKVIKTAAAGSSFILNITFYK